MGTELELTLLRQSPDATIFSNLDGEICFWNVAATRIFGFSVEQAMGASLDILIPERFRKAHWAGYHSAVRKGVSKYNGQSLTTRSVRADGRKIYITMSFAIVHDNAGVVLGAIATARDITESFEKQKHTDSR